MYFHILRFIIEVLVKWHINGWPLWCTWVVKHKNISKAQNRAFCGYWEMIQYLLHICLLWFLQFRLHVFGRHLLCNMIFNEVSNLIAHHLLSADVYYNVCDMMIYSYNLTRNFGGWIFLFRDMAVKSNFFVLTSI